MKKKLYIYEFYREGDEVECDWFVGESTDDYSKKTSQAYNHLSAILDESIKDLKEQHTITNVFEVDFEMIEEVYKGGI